MKINKSDRGFEFLDHEVYPPGADHDSRLASQSSVVGDYEDSFERPGSSALWVGMHHHLNREEVAQFVSHLQHWLDTGKLGE